MNRRGFFSFLAVAPVAMAMPVPLRTKPKALGGSDYAYDMLDYAYDMLDGYPAGTIPVGAIVELAPLSEDAKEHIFSLMEPA